LKVVFAGTPEFAAQHLQALIDSEHDVVAVYCPPDKPAGRGKKLTACATKNLAIKHGIVVEQPLNFKEGIEQETLSNYQADVMVVVAYGLLLPVAILETPTLGCINVHGSILPKWRGAAPIQRSLEAGDKKTGITIMQMDKGLDTGDMILAAECAIENTDTSASLYEKLANLGPTALVDTLALMVQPNYQASDHNITQDNKLATYAKKLDKTEAELNWQLSAGELHRKVRAYIPWPVSQFTFTESESDPENKQHRLRVWQASVQVYQGNSDPGTIIKADKEGIEVATSDGSLRLEVIQLPGKKALPVKDILNGRSDWFVVGSNINKLG
jgi:methionyl-tRNA formyltransferase